MDTKNFIVENKIKFLTNKSDYPHQPVFTLVNNNSLTGNDFISLYRYVTNDEYSNDITDYTDGKIRLTIGADGQFVSGTGGREITSMPIIRGSEELDPIDITAAEDPRSSTSEPTEYTFITSLADNRIDVITAYSGLFYRDITIDSLTSIRDMNYLGTSHRPMATGPNADGVGGNSLVLQYLFNREDLPFQTGAGSSVSAVQIADKSGNDLHGEVLGQGKGNDPTEIGIYETQTVTGWENGPIEGSFRLEGDAADPTYIRSPNSTLFHNHTDEALSGMTMMAHVKFNSTGDCNIMSLVSTSGTVGTIFGLSLRNGAITVDTVGTDAANTNGFYQSCSAGKYDEASAEHPNATFRHTDIGKWMHICARVDMGFDPDKYGTTLFINGEKVPLLGSQSTISADMKNIITVNNGSLMNFGIANDLSGSALTGCVGLTRYFNSALTDQEIFQNYIATIPSNIVIESIKIG